MENFPDLQTIVLRLAFIAGSLVAWFATQRTPFVYRETSQAKPWLNGLKIRDSP